MTVNRDEGGREPVNILLVDDQPANLLALEATLSDLGENLVTAPSGEAALRHLLRGEFAVVLLDVQMPGMDGFETARYVRSRPRSRYTPIIFLTAFESTDFSVSEAYALGAVDFLVKPFVPAILKAKVAGFVDLFRKTEEVKRQGERLREMERREFERQLAEEKLRHAEVRYREIDRLNAELEQRVRERTAALEKEVAERERMTAELTRSNQELEQFAYVASHDLKEPLRKIRVYLQLLDRHHRDRLTDEAAEFLAYAVDGARRMQDLVNDLLAYARVGSRGQPFQPASCAAAFDQAVANLEAAIRESNAGVSRGDLPTVSADETQLVQLFQNLVGNAIKFRRDERPTVRVEATRAGAGWRFAVRDNRRFPK